MKNYEEAEQDYMSGMTYKALADKYNVSVNTVKSWKSRHGWNRKSKPHDGNQYAKGNKGNKHASAPKGNRNGVKHGLFSKYIPKETLDIMNEIEENNAVDILWQSILLQYSAIIRAQRIMNPETAEEYTSYFTAMSRASAELRSSLRQFKDLATEDDERLLKLEQMKLNITKTKTEIENLGNGTADDQVVIVDDVAEMRKIMDANNQSD